MKPLHVLVVLFLVPIYASDFAQGDVVVVVLQLYLVVVVVHVLVIFVVLMIVILQMVVLFVVVLYMVEVF